MSILKILEVIIYELTVLETSSKEF